MARAFRHAPADCEQNEPVAVGSRASIEGGLRCAQTGVFSGGGIKGLAFAGAVTAAQEAGYEELCSEVFEYIEGSNAAEPSALDD